MNFEKGKSHSSGGVEDQKGRKKKGKKVMVGKRKKRATGREDGNVGLIRGRGKMKRWQMKMVFWNMRGWGQEEAVS
jgi:hypothetical protein